jgi:hypothetical protein
LPDWFKCNVTAARQAARIAALRLFVNGGHDFFTGVEYAESDEPALLPIDTDRRSWRLGT